MPPRSDRKPEDFYYKLLRAESKCELNVAKYLRQVAESEVGLTADRQKNLKNAEANSEIDYA